MLRDPICPMVAEPVAARTPMTEVWYRWADALTRKLKELALSIVNINTALDDLLIVPQVIRNGNYTVQLSDTAKHWYHTQADTSARTWTLAADSEVAYPIGHITTFCNDNATYNVTLAGSSGVTLLLVGDGTTGNITIAPKGAATALKVAANRWMVQGKGATN